MADEIESLLHLGIEAARAGLKAEALALPSTLPRLPGPRPQAVWETEALPVEEAPPPVGRVCPRCGASNPGWAYICDRCGANLRQPHVQEAVGPTVRPRQRGFPTLLEAWGAALVFSRTWAFVAELPLASPGRSLALLLIVGCLPVVLLTWVGW